MAHPNSIFVSPSTTLVQVDTLQNPYTPVIINAVEYPGQVITVLNTISDLSVYLKPIVLSTATSTFFVAFGRSSISTLIQQPQGYVTLQSKLPNQWNFLNSYPFRDQFLSAATQVITVSSLYSHIISTQVDQTSSLRVENLIVSGQFFQSSGLTLNTNVSSLGAVTLLSSLTVLGTGYFSSSVASLGFSQFRSTVSVGKDFSALSTLQFSTLTISTSLSVMGTLSTGELAVQLRGGLIGRDLEVQQSSGTSAFLGGGLRVGGILEVTGEVRVGSNLDLFYTTVGTTLSTLSSVTVQQPLFVGLGTIVHSSILVSSSAQFGGNVAVRDDLHVKDTLRGGFDLLVQGSLQSLSSLSTNALFARDATIAGDVTIYSLNGVSVPILQIGGSVGFEHLVAKTLTLGRNLSTTSDLVSRGQLFFQSTLVVQGSLSTLSSVVGVSHVSVEGGIFARGSLLTDDSCSLLGNVDVRTTAVISSLSSILVHKDMSVLDSIFVTNLAQLSSIGLPQNATAFNFQVVDLVAGVQGTVSSVAISTLYASSFMMGNLVSTAVQMEMTTILESPTLYTTTLWASSVQLHFPLDGRFQSISSLGVGQLPIDSQVNIQTNAYTLSNTYIEKILSTLTISSQTFLGRFSGDGAGLQNVNYPERISTLYLSTGALVVERTYISSAVFSSGIVTDVFTTFSTLQVGTFTLYGNADSPTKLQPEVLTSNTMAAYTLNSKLISLNNMDITGDAQDSVAKQIIINPSILPSLVKTNVLGVGGVLHIQELISPNLLLEIDTYSGDILVAQTVGLTTTNTVYVSSGVIGPNGNGAFFIPDGYTPQILSTNIIQVVQSTLVFNSTLFVDRAKGKVGINTDPYYTLDVNSNALIYSQVIGSQSTLITDEVVLQQSTVNVWFAATANGLLTSVDGDIWQPSPYADPLSFLTPYAIAYSGGPLTFTTSNTLIAQKKYVLASQSNVQSLVDGPLASWRPGFPVDSFTGFPERCLSVAYNGFFWVMTGTNDMTFIGITIPTLFWSSDGIAWYKAVSGGFTYDSSNPAISTIGGYCVSWNGLFWIAAGQGENAENSLLYSMDSKNWYNSRSDSFKSGANSVVWTGSRWVATGNNGQQSSFMTSVDGFNWTGLDGYGFASSEGSYAGRGYGIAANDSVVVAVGSYNPAYPNAKSIQYSEDGGLTWSNAFGTLFDTAGDAGSSVAWNGSYWLASGRSGVRVSKDGVTWSSSTSSPSHPFYGLMYTSNATPIAQIGASNYVSSVTTTFTTFQVACGQQTGGAQNCLRYSEDGITWLDSTSGFFTAVARGAVYDGSNYWVAVGKGSMAAFVYGANGKNWSNAFLLDIIDLNATGTSVTHAVTPRKSWWVATTDDVTAPLWYSSNGFVWYKGSSSGSALFSVAGYGSAYDPTNDVWVAVGDDGLTGNTIQYVNAEPPISWTESGVTGQFDQAGRAVAYGNSQFVAVGSDTGGRTIKFSVDGISWADGIGTVFGTEGFGVDYDGVGTWVAVGQGSPTSSNILYSLDGRNWGNILSGDFDTVGNGVRYNRGSQMWIATGSQSTIKYSYNATDWFDAIGGFDSVGYGVGVASNTIYYQSTSINQLRIYNTPGSQVTTRILTANIAYTPSTMILNNTIILDSQRNISIQSPYTKGILSTFYVANTTRISTFTSTGTVQAGGLFLSFANV